MLSSVAAEAQVGRRAHGQRRHAFERRHDVLAEQRVGPAEVGAGELGRIVRIERLVEQMVAGIGSKMGSALLALNKCPDFEVNRGHYFGTGLIAGEPALSDDDKMALIEFLKTF